MARFPSRAKNTGRRASASMRGAGASVGRRVLSDEFIRKLYHTGSTVWARLTIFLSSGRHEPQLVPARKSLPIFSALVAPDATAFSISARPTAKQQQTSGPV